MATKRVQFFSTLDELLKMVCRLVNTLNLNVFLYRGGPNAAITQGDCETIVSQVRTFNASRLYLADQVVTVSEINPDELEPGRLGLLQVMLPRESGRALYMSEAAIKSDWIDSVTGKRCENRQLLSLFKQVKKILLKEMLEPVLGKNIITGRTKVYSTIKYTLAAKAFVEAGGELMQEGVNNIKFQPILENTR